jgi:TM2 domain-containing membrane protein YozV
MAAINVDVGNIAGGLFQLIDKLFTTDEERQNAKLRLLELQQKGQLAQLAVNAVEAKHENIFVAGWRPFIGWVCGFAFAYNFIIQPLFVFLIWALTTFYGVEFPIANLPDLDMASLLAVLGGILGLGTLRTYEKRTGTNMNRGSPGDGSLY